MANTNVDTITETAIPARFLELLAARDFEELGGILAEDARARMLLPRGLEEHAGRDAIVRRIESWFGSASEFELAKASEDVIGRRHRLTWRFSVVRDGSTRELVEQLVFLDIGPRGVEQLDLLCSGFQLTSCVVAAAAEVFDAGAMGCADGLAEEFRRQLAKVPVGASLEVVVRDPAAKEDLPSLARMLGQAVTSTEAHDDGRLTVTVEKRK